MMRVLIFSLSGLVLVASNKAGYYQGPPVMAPPQYQQYPPPPPPRSSPGFLEGWYVRTYDLLLSITPLVVCFLSGPAARPAPFQFSLSLSLPYRVALFLSVVRSKPGRAVLLLPARRVLLRPLRHFRHMIPIKGAV
jgi:hypothetical protein